MSKIRLAVISDLHYYSPSLGTSGRAYELRSGSDQKALAESGAVIDTVFDRLGSSDVDAVLIPGDLTNDGERVSHEEIREKLRLLRTKKPVYLITSTHDWCTDGNARRFSGDETLYDVPTLGAEELSSYYDEFGAETKLAEYRTGRGFYSRCYQVAPGLRLLAVNDDMDGEGGKSGYSPAHLDWMREQLRAAEAAGDKVVAMEHHMMLYHLSPLINKGQSIGDSYAAAEALADAGLRLIFVGHSHMQRTVRWVSPAGNPITQINVGALCGYPAPINYLTVEDGVARHRVEFLESFLLDGDIADGVFFKKHTTAVLDHVLDAAAGKDPEELKARLGAHGIRVKENLFPLLRFASRRLKNATVGGAGGWVNFLTLGRGLNKKAVAALKEEPLLPYVKTLFLCVFDGSERLKTWPKWTDDAKTVVLDVGRLPGRVVKKLPIKKEKKEKLLNTVGQIRALVTELAEPCAPDNAESETAL